VHAQPLLTESFNYSGGTVLNAANWSIRASGTPTVSATAGNLAIASTIANNLGNKANLGNTSAPLSYGARIYIRSNGAGFSFGVLRGASTTPEYESVVRNFDTNYFIVLKYEVLPGTTNDLAKLFVSSSVISSEPSTPSVVYGAPAGEDISASVP
jgi:hypothetical protein